MESFLSEIAHILQKEYPDSLDQVTVVFNNRRSGLFLRQQFLKQAEKPLFLPRTIGMDTLVSELSDMEIIPNELLLFELFDIHRNLLGENRRYDTFEEFISFGDMMLADFSEVDLYCIDAKQLFANLHDIKSIGEWDIESGHLTSFQERYLVFYRTLYQYYNLLHQRLQTQHKAYAGMAYRHVAENIESLLSQYKEQQLCFVGFNALSTSEERIIQHCIACGRGSLYTDGDSYYFDNEQQEAGRFLRKNCNRFPTIGQYSNHFAEGKKNITIVNCPENTLQCKYAGGIIETELQQHPGDNLNQTAIVLSDESLLLPVLNSLPQKVKTANITMGFPFSNTDTYALSLKLFSLQQRRRGNTFYHQDIQSILSDQLFSTFLGTSNIHSKIEKILYAEHIIYAPYDTISSLGQKIGIDLSSIGFIFGETNPTPDDFLQMMHRIIQLLYDSNVLESDNKEREALACFLEIVNHLLQIQQQYHFIENLSVLLKIYTRLAQRRSVAFYGEPLSGLQILGVLETRNLDFKRVILLSANEGVLPSGRSFNSLIPYNLKTAFGLPTFHEKDAVYAYNFYRLLQRAEDIYLLYSTETDMMGKGEPSRFIHQLRRELVPQYPKNITITEKVLVADNASPLGKTQDVGQKNREVLDRINELITRGLSPSGLNKYRACPLKFYYENILHIDEPDRVSEDLEQNELGSCIHSVLETIYSSSKDNIVNPDTLQQALSRIDEIIDDALAEQFQHGRNLYGRNHFLRAVARTQITDFLKSEIKHLQTDGSIEIVGLEKELSHGFDVTVGADTRHVVVKGVADRIDIANGTLRIIDYKSGKVDPRDLKVASADPDWNTVSDKWFQLMTYEWLYSNTQSSSLPHVSGIFPLGHLHSNLLTASWEGKETITRQHLDTFETMLHQIAEEMLNPDIPFAANHNSKMCLYCPFEEACKLKVN